jgi:uncharacterized protein (DUF1697 family)
MGDEVTRYVALLRGINVGTAKRVAMSDLRAVLEELGYRDVRTLLNSGNVVFGGREAQPGAIARRIEAAVARRTGVSARVQVLTAETFSAAVEGNVLAPHTDNPSRLLVSFCDDPARLAELAPFERQDWARERIAVGRHAAYLWCPESIVDSELGAAVGRVLRDSSTARNWATVLKLQAMLPAGSTAPTKPAARAPARRPARATKRR